MALFDYTRIRKKQPERSVNRVSYEKKSNVYKSEYYNLPDEFRYIVRFSFVVIDPERGIQQKNALLRNIINKKAVKAHIPMNGARFITVHEHGRIVYNIVLDKLLSAIWLFTQIVEVDSIDDFTWLKRERKGMTPIEYVENFKRCRQILYNEITNVFRTQDDIAKVEVDGAGLYIGETRHEPRDFDPASMPIYYTGKPRYRAYQPFGNLSGNHKSILKQ